MTQAPDEFLALLAKVRAGDQAALAQLARQYEPELRVVARVLVGPLLRPYLDSLDLVQSVHRSLLIGVRNRMVVALDWIWDYLTFQRGARLINEATPSREMSSREKSPFDTNQASPSNETSSFDTSEVKLSREASSLDTSEASPSRETSSVDASQRAKLRNVIE